MKPGYERLDAYASIMKAFLDKKLDCAGYRARFFELNSAETSLEPRDALELMADMFHWVELCEPDPALLRDLRRDSPDMGYIDESELRRKTASFYEQLEALPGRRRGA